MRDKLLRLRQAYRIALGKTVVAVKQDDGSVKPNQLFKPVAAGAVSGKLLDSLSVCCS